MACRHCCLEQVQGPGDIGVDEGPGRMAGDVRLVKRAGVDDRLDAMFAEDPVDQRAIGD